MLLGRLDAMEFRTNYGSSLQSNFLQIGNCLSQLSLNDDGRYLAALGQYDSAVAITDSRNGAVLSRIPTNFGRQTTSMDASRDTLAVAADNIYLYSIPSGALLRTIPSHTQGGQYVAFFPEGGRVAVAGGYTQQIGGQSFETDIRIYDTTSGQQVDLYAYTTPVTSVAASKNGLYLAGGNSGGLKLWNAQTHTLIAQLPGAGPMVFSPDSAHLAVWNGGMIKVYNSADGSLEQSWPFAPTVNGIAFGPGGNSLYLATGVPSVAIFRTDGTLLADYRGEMGSAWFWGVGDVVVNAAPLTFSRSPAFYYCRDDGVLVSCPLSTRG
jgi:WD40 repeat protein